MHEVTSPRHLHSKRATATGVTDGTMLKGVRRVHNRIFTQSIVMRSKTGTVRLIEAEHNLPVKSGVVPHFTR